MSPKTTPPRQPVPVLIALSNARRPRRPAGARTPTTADPFGSAAAARVLLEPLGLEQSLGDGELDDLNTLADETHAIAEALVSDREPPSLGTLNRLAEQASATRVLRVGPDRTLTANVRWHAAGAVAELACRLVDELGRLDRTRLRHCSREACDLLFYDTTRPGTQRWHSESPCGLRERQERWRKTTTRADQAVTA